MKRTFWKTVRLLWVVAGLTSVLWLWNAYQAHGVPDGVFTSSPLVRVVQGKDLVSFVPVSSYRTVLIFYPGALVDPDAYAPLCRHIADSGIKSVIVKMPWRLASGGYNKPRELGLFADTTKQYVLAGHSQGGKMAAQFVFENPGLISRLVLLGTTHPRDIDVSGCGIPVMKIYGSSDGVADVAGVNANKKKLPATTRYVLLQGANHAQFGYYGFQAGDNKAGITRSRQQQLVLDSMLSFISVQ